MSHPEKDLLAATAALVAIPSVSRNEGPLADYVEAALRDNPGLEVVRVADNVVARTHLGRPARVVLAGHLDTVPPQDNDVPRTEGDVLWGLGSTDMKGGLAVMLDLATSGEAEASAKTAYDVTYVFYVAEEIARQESGLLALAAARPELLEATVAIVCEPTNCSVQAGCQGVIRFELVMGGSRAHVARPWTGTNALHRLAPVLSAVAGWAPREVDIDGCTYRESLQAVRSSAGVASNVMPDRATIELNYRFAPDRSPLRAEATILELLSPWMAAGDTLKVIDSAPAAPPSLQHPLIAALVGSAEAPVTAKLGWTDVAFFSERGIPAANFGPGDPELAHTQGERTTRASLQRARSVLGRLLGV
jgi:succinyl-diaminopimelate desuccinylase